jgi:formate dehydrogenase iron-sulfur subunit
MMKAILTDVTKCIGCEKCVAACVQQNQLPEKSAARWVRGDGLSGERFCSVLRKDEKFIRKQCRHCQEPACASACPVGALHKTGDGPVAYDSDKCLGCRYCMMACPFGIPRYQWESAAPYVRKCTMCYETRIKQGKQPACTEACPEKATIFGERDALLAEAKSRIAANPGLYKPKIWGETDVGGTNVMYLSPVDLDFLYLGSSQPNTVFPKLTVTAMGAVPPAFVGMGVLMGSVYWIIDRRMKLAGKGGEAEHSEKHEERKNKP